VSAATTPAPQPAAPAPGRSDAELLRGYKRARTRERNTIWALWILIGVGLLVGWQVASGTIVDEIWVSSPELVWERLQTWFSDGTIWPHIVATLQETALGFVIGTVAALLLALPLGLSSFANRVLYPYLVAAYAIPKITLAPLFIVWFGIGLQMKVVLAAVVTFFLIFFSTLEAVRTLDRDLVTVVRVCGASRFQMVRTMLLPSALGGILTGMKIALPYTLQAALFAEILASNEGLGYLIQLGSSQFDLTGVFAALVLVTAIAVPLNQGVDYVERYTQRWRLE
jgi:NitT/TauT family transport system permease protein